MAQVGHRGAHLPAHPTPFSPPQSFFFIPAFPPPQMDGK